MDMKTALIQKEKLELAYAQACRAMRKYPKLPNGLTPYSIKSSPQWRADKKTVEIAFAEICTFNAKFVKAHGREYREYMRGKRGAAVQFI